MGIVDNLVNDAEEVWKVLQHRGNGRWATVIEAGEAAVMQYVENHFPRIHVQPNSGGEEPQPDAKVVGPDGAEYVFQGPEAGYQKVKDGESTEDTPIFDELANGDDDDDDDDAAAATPTKTAAAKKSAPAFSSKGDNK